MVVVRGRLTPEVGSVLRRALEAACDQARQAPGSDPGDEESADAPDEGASEAAGASVVAAAGATAVADERTFVQRQADAIRTIAEVALAGGLDRGTAGDRYQVVLHVDAEALAEPRDVPAGTSGDAAAGSKPRAGGDRVPAGTAATTPASSGGARRRMVDAHGNAGPGRTRPTPLPDFRPVSGDKVDVARIRACGIRTCRIRRLRSEFQSRGARVPAGDLREPRRSPAGFPAHDTLQVGRRSVRTSASGHCRPGPLDG